MWTSKDGALAHCVVSQIAYVNCADASAIVRNQTCCMNLSLISCLLHLSNQMCHQLGQLKNLPVSAIWIWGTYEIKLCCRQVECGIAVQWASLHLYRQVDIHRLIKPAGLLSGCMYVVKQLLQVNLQTKNKLWYFRPSTFGRNWEQYILQDYHMSGASQQSKLSQLASYMNFMA